MVSHPTTNGAETNHDPAQRIHLQSAAAGLLTAARDAYHAAEAERERIRLGSELATARTVRQCMAYLPFMAVSEMVGIERTRLRRILRDHPEAVDDRLAG